MQRGDFVNAIFDYPLDVKHILRKKNALIRDLEGREGLLDLKVAVLGGSSTQDIVKMSNLFLLSKGYKALFYESDYNRYYETALFSSELEDFKPDIVYVFTTGKNILWKPSVGNDNNEIETGISNEIKRLKEIISKIKEKPMQQLSSIIMSRPKYGCLGIMMEFILQDNFITCDNSMNGLLNLSKIHQM